jgi:hypothetical protein
VRDRDDLAGRLVRVLQDLRGLRRFTEKVPAPFARRETLREDALARAGLPGEDPGDDREEPEKDFSPERQHPDMSVAGVRLAEMLR